MSAVNVHNITVLGNPARLTDKFEFEITFECVSALTDDLEWRVTYVGSASSAEYDQELENVLVGPVPIGISKFVLSTNPPDPSKIPEDDLLGATVVMLNCAYKGKEFIRVGYWISNTYADEVEGVEPPKPCPPNMIVRNILADKPRVTRFAIDWS